MPGPENGRISIRQLQGGSLADLPRGIVMTGRPGQAAKRATFGSCIFDLIKTWSWENRFQIFFTISCFLPGYLGKMGWKFSSIIDLKRKSYNGVESKRLLPNAI